MISDADFLVFRLRPHDDLKMKITQIVHEQNIKAGVVVSCVGSLEQFNLRFANQPAGTSREGYFEILSLTGTVSTAGVHLHLTIGDNHGDVTGGHLLDRNLIYTTAEITIAILRDVEFKRELDTTYGFHELTIHQAPTS
jgi:uncharacterized protein